MASSRLEHSKRPRQCVSAFLLILLLHSAVTEAGLDKRIELQLPAQPLAQALSSLGRQSQISIIFSPTLLADIQAAEIKGAINTSAALDRLLAGSGLEWQKVGARAVAITPIEPISPSDAQALKIAPPQLEEVIVTGFAHTGSRLRHAGIDHSQPLRVIGAPEISQSNAQTLADFLQQLPQVAGNSTNTSVGNGGNGSATLALRGLPAYYTLILLDGQRIAGSGHVGIAVDLNTLPLAAVDRIEILSSGASAIYGSDAIAGTINIITRKDFDGAQFKQSYGQSSRGDLNSRNSQLLIGKNTDSASITVAINDTRQEGLYSRERGFNADMRDKDGSDLRPYADASSHIFVPSSQPPYAQFITPVRGNGQSADDYRPVNADDRFNYGDYTSAVAPSEQQSINLHSRYSFNDDTKVQIRLGSSRTQSTTTHAPTPITSSDDVQWSVAADNIYNPFGMEPWYIERRLMEVGSRQQENSTASDWLQLSFDHDFSSAPDSAIFSPNAPMHWSIDTFYSESNGYEQVDNVIDPQRLIQALGPSDHCNANNNCVPLNLFGPAGSITPEQANYIRGQSNTEGYSRNYGIETQFDGRLWQTPNGPIALATGLTFRHEEDFLKSQKQLMIGSASAPQVDTNRDIGEWFVEADIPLLQRLPGAHSLDLQIAARHAWYSDFGHHTSPSVGLSYRSSPDWLWRASYSEGYVAPQLDTLEREGFSTQAHFIDPCSFASNVGVLPECTVQSDPGKTQFLTVLNGNPDLQPEESTHYSTGFSWTPTIIDNLQFDANYYLTEIDEVINSLGNIIATEGSQLPINVTRDSNGNITRLDAQLFNGGERLVEAVDLELGYAIDSQSLGYWQWRASGSRLLDYRDLAQPNNPDENLSGTYTASGNDGLPKWKASASLAWDNTLDGHRFGINYNTHYTSAMMEDVPMSNREREIDSWLVHNIQLNYRPKAWQWLQLQIGIDNIADTDAPVVTSSFSDGIDARSHNLKGRYYFAQVSFLFE